LAVSQDLLEWLRYRRKIESRSFGCGVVEEVLLGKDRFAGAGAAHDEVDRVGENAAPEHAVEAR
jgi:hypothetical protein